MCHLKDNVGNTVYTCPPNDVHLLYSKFSSHGLEAPECGFM